MNAIITDSHNTIDTYNPITYCYRHESGDVIEFRSGNERTEAEYELDFLTETPITPMAETPTNQDLVNLHQQIRGEIITPNTDDDIDPELKYAMALLAEKAEEEAMLEQRKKIREENTEFNLMVERSNKKDDDATE